ncbi:NAD(P)-binding protein, partial [Armillaria solidipes]
GQFVRVALYNTTHDVWKPFLDITPEDVQGMTQTNLGGAFAFSKNVIQVLQANQVDEKGRRGSSIFTGATASVRGNVTTSVFSSGKHALRALSQSLAKEFGKQNIHVSHAIIDGGILTNSARERRNDPEWEQNEDVRLSPDRIAESYLHLIKQPRSAWTWELDLRPAHEKW